MAMKVYVAILTYNRLHKIRHLLDNPYFWHGVDECWVLAQACNDGTVEWLHSQQQQWGSARCLHVLSSWQNRMAIGGRQRLFDMLTGYGLREGDVVITLDDDVMCFSPNWTRGLVTPLSNTKIGAVGVQGFDIEWDYNLLFVGNRVPGPVDIVNGGWTAYSGRVFQAGVEIDQEYYPFWHADSDFAMQIREKGFEVVQGEVVGLAHEPHNMKVTELWEERREMFINKWRGKGLVKAERVRDGNHATTD